MKMENQEKTKKETQSTIKERNQEHNQNNGLELIKQSRTNERNINKE